MFFDTEATISLDSLFVLITGATGFVINGSIALKSFLGATVLLKVVGNKDFLVFEFSGKRLDLLIIVLVEVDLTTGDFFTTDHTFISSSHI